MVSVTDCYQYVPGSRLTSGKDFFQLNQVYIFFFSAHLSREETFYELQSGYI